MPSAYYFLYKTYETDNNLLPIVHLIDVYIIISYIIIATSNWIEFIV